MASISRFLQVPRSPSSGRTARAKRRWRSCCAGSTTRRRAPSRSTASIFAISISTSWRARVAAVFQDFVRFELPLRDNVAPGGAPDDVDPRGARRGRRREPGRASTPILARGYEGGTDLSGGQWQRIALARALCAVTMGAGLVLLDEPTAQLDVRGEAEIFERLLAGDAALHDHPDLAPLLDRAPRRSHLRSRTRPRRRAGHA